MAQHVNYDRFVLEFEEHVPAYDIAYAHPPFIDIPGNMVGVCGNAFLAVNLHGASTVDWEESAGEDIVLSYEGPWRVTATTDNYTEAVFVTDFESDMEWIVGLADRVPFRVIELASPARLVIDVGHGDVTKAEIPTQMIDGKGTGFGWMADSRLAGHDTFDRFVIQFRGGYQPGDDYPEPGRPNYMIHYATGPFGGCDATDLIPVDGDAFIMVELRPATGTDWNVDPPRVIYTGENRLAADTVNITEAVLAGECEGIQWVIGVDAVTTFSVTWMTNPLRLVIDVPHVTVD